MTPQSPAANRRIPTVLRMLLTATSVAIIIITVAACSGETSPNQHETRDIDDRPARTIEALDRKIAELEAKASDARRANVDEPMAVPTKTPRTITAEQRNTDTKKSTPAPAPTQLMIPTPAGPGICGRTPEIQQAILSTLRISSCRLVTNEELFRITVFYNLPAQGVSLNFTELKEGDLAGLVNLKFIYIKGEEDPNREGVLESLRTFSTKYVRKQPRKPSTGRKLCGGTRRPEAGYTRKTGAVEQGR